jgi:hypothetical protein
MTTTTNTAGNQTSEAGDSATPSEATQVRSARTATVNLPFVTATFHKPETLHLPQIRVPDRQQVLSAAQAVQSYLPSPEQAAYFGGLAALAAFEVLEWPVALAIGAGTALMGRFGQRQPQSVHRPEPATVATKENTTSMDQTTNSRKTTEPPKAGESSPESSADTPASSALTASPGARTHDDRRKIVSEHHTGAQRDLFNRLLGWWPWPSR